MKLTKGKITKLYSKKKQSRKRYKNTTNESKIKTFRKRRSLDLTKRTLKRISYGGAKLGDEITSGQQLDDPETVKDTILPKAEEEKKEQQTPLDTGEITSESLKSTILPKGEQEITEQQEEQEQASNQAADQTSVNADQASVNADQASVNADQASVKAEQASVNADQASVNADQASVKAEQGSDASFLNKTSDEEGSDKFSSSQILSYDQSIDFDSDNSTIAQAFKTLADYVANNIAAKIKSGLVPPLVTASQTQAGVENLSASQTLATTQSQPAVDESIDNTAELP